MLVKGEASASLSFFCFLSLSSSFRKHTRQVCLFLLSLSFPLSPPLSEGSILRKYIEEAHRGKEARRGRKHIGKEAHKGKEVYRGKKAHRGKEAYRGREAHKEKEVYRGREVYRGK
jgi:hypothetical protein